MTRQHKPLLFIGLDYEDPERVLSLADKLQDIDEEFGFKLNLDFFINDSLNDLGNFEEISSMGRPIFADLKMWNGRRTMESIARNLAKKGISYTNVYAHAGEPFIKGVIEELKDTPTKLLGLTVLTHYTDKDTQRLYGCGLRDAVRRLSNTAYSAGCQGIIVPGTALDVVSNMPMEKLVPAVRPEWYGKTGENYQQQETSVKEAIRMGANLLVCSSPIRKSKEPREALLRTLDEIEKYSANI